MKTLRIDFAPHSIRRALYRARFLAWVVVGTGLLLCASAAIVALQLKGSHETLKKSIGRLEQKIAEREARKPAAAPPIAEAQAAAVNSAILQLNLPWRDVLDAIEAATPSTIALLALEPDAKKHKVKGIAEAKTGESMIAYIEDLKRQKYFDEVVLTRHETNDHDPNRPLRFNFEAHWQEGSP
jgi:Tfp pilus assembly protein PilN